MTAYNSAFDPPAPFLTVRLSTVAQQAPSATFESLLDSGADISVIPLSLVTDLNLQPSGLMIVEGFDSKPRRLPLFAVDLVIENVPIPGVEVVAYQVDHGILGRDVLNQFRLMLDGPDQNLEIL